jgi:hypothetical protein
LSILVFFRSWKKKGSSRKWGEDTDRKPFQTFQRFQSFQSHEGQIKNRIAIWLLKGTEVFDVWND